MIRLYESENEHCLYNSREAVVALPASGERHVDHQARSSQCATNHEVRLCRIHSTMTARRS
jgi:hypothetical protein